MMTDPSDRPDRASAGGMIRGMSPPPVLVTGATGRIGGAVVDLLADAGVPVRAPSCVVPRPHRRSRRASTPSPAMGRTAYVTSTVVDIFRSTRTFRQWVADHATAFRAAR
jgi:nucleoside-diphosphate-sugar epimerase